MPSDDRSFLLCCILLLSLSIISVLYFSFLCLSFSLLFFFFNDPAPPEISPLSLHDALPIFPSRSPRCTGQLPLVALQFVVDTPPVRPGFAAADGTAVERRDRQTRAALAACLRRIAALRSEEHTSELQSRSDLVCRLLLEKKK